MFEPRNGFDSVRVVLCVMQSDGKKTHPPAPIIAGLRLNVLLGVVRVALRLCAPLPPGWGAGNGLQRVGHWQAVGD